MTDTTWTRRTPKEAWPVLVRSAKDSARALLRPPMRLTLSDWADRHRILSREASAEAGPWRTSRVPYLRGIMDAITDPSVHRIVWMAASQVGKTEVILNTIGYFIDQDPSPILVVQPTLLYARDFSKDRLMPMLRDSPSLRGKVHEGRDDSDTILHKRFPGGHITLVGSNSASGLSSRPIRVVLFDEVDRYPESADKQGSPIAMGEQRARTFWNKLIFLCASPSLKGGIMDREFARGDQRRFWVHCPHCGDPQVLKWGGEEDAFGLKWEKEVSEGETLHKFHTAAYLCEHCGTLIEEDRKPETLASGDWVAANPDSHMPSFHLSALYSPWMPWWEMAAEFVQKSHGPAEELQTFVNLQLGEPWEERDRSFDPHSLEGRRESYAAEVPAQVGLLTAGVDVHDDRLEVAVKGWGAGEESWLIRHERIHGGVEREDTWARLRALLDRGWKHESGATIHIRAAMIDSGHRADMVYAFVRGRERRGIYALKGLDNRASRLLNRATRQNRHQVKLWSVNTVVMKDILFRRVKLERPGPGYMHFCKQDESIPGGDAEYFAQFGAERLVPKKIAGRYVRVYQQVRERNEAIDLEVYNLAALHSLGPGVRETLGEKAKALAAAKDEAPAPPKRPARMPRGHGGRGGWVNRY